MKKSGNGDDRRSDGSWTYIGPEQTEVIEWDKPAPKGIISEEWMCVPVALRRVIVDCLSVKGKK